MSGDAGAAPANGCQDFHNTLNEFRHKQVFCDVTIYGEDDRVVHAHSIVLAAGSEVLKSTLTQRPANRAMQKHGFVLKIEGITANIWKLLLDFLYLRRLSVQLSPAVLKELYLASRLLGIKNLVASLGSLIETMELKVNPPAPRVDIRLSRRLKLREKAVQVESYAGGDSPPRKRRVNTPMYAARDDDEDYTPRGGVKRSMTSQVRQRLATSTPQQQGAGRWVQCLSPSCSQRFPTINELNQHHFSCLMADTAYRVQEYAYKDDDGRLIYSDPFEMEDGGLQAPYATLMEEEVAEAPPRYQCAHCSRQDAASRMIMHLAYIHGRRRPIHCGSCQSKFKDLRCFLDHYVTTHAPSTLACIHCFLRFESRQKLKRHMLEAHNKQSGAAQSAASEGPKQVYQCGQCEKRFISKADCERHQKQSHGGETTVYQCSQCDFKNTRKAAVILHERSHGIITANYMCLTCGRAYLSDSAYSAHVTSSPDHVVKHVTKLTPEELQRFVEMGRSAPGDDSAELLEGFMDSSAADATSSDFSQAAKIEGTDEEEEMSAEEAQAAVLAQAALTSQAAQQELAAAQGLSGEEMAAQLAGQAMQEGAEAPGGQEEEQDGGQQQILLVEGGEERAEGVATSYQIAFRDANGQTTQVVQASGGKLGPEQLEQLIKQNIHGAWAETGQDGETVLYAVVDQ